MYNYLINFRPVLLGAPLQLGALSARLVRLWVNPTLVFFVFRTFISAVKKPKHSKAQSTMPTSRDIRDKPFPETSLDGKFRGSRRNGIWAKGDVTGSRHSGFGFIVFWLFTADLFSLSPFLVNFLSVSVR